ncbi:protein Wnt-8a-like [Cylas formicarius]|uniref:protein Wnt-8a-like n=1 Tax=Cylas formicarius TaxID=197179 RepID=UPI002958B3E5|nr:protein Wnt-8a-like [Cylas formicarius]
MIVPARMYALVFWCFVPGGSFFEFATPGGINPKLMESVSGGTLLALEHCRGVFRWDRWNCPKEEFARRAANRTDREAAFSNAILAAGIVHAITRNCSRGEIDECGCASKPPDHPGPYEADLDGKNHPPGTVADWSWGGCSDTTGYAEMVTSDLLEKSRNDADGTSLVEAHNFRVGIEMVRETMVRRCRCHGMSGSCSLQTCWLQTAPFEQLARKLREKYGKALRLSKDTAQAYVRIGNSIQHAERRRSIQLPGNRLVYLDQSPDYCVENEAKNWPGTKGRSCSRSRSELATVAERKSCRNLCRQCGHKVKKQKRLATTRCNCKFEWCCAVKCDICTENVDEFYCD